MLTSKNIAEGSYKEKVDALSIPDEKYFYRIKPGNYVQARKMSLLNLKILLQPLPILPQSIRGIFFVIEPDFQAKEPKQWFEWFI